MRLYGTLLKILMASQNVLFWKHDSLAFRLWRWCLFLVLILCTGEFVWKFSWLMTMFIKENIWWHGTDKISNFLSRFLQEFYIIHQPLFGQFYFVNMFPLLDDYPKKLLHTFNRVKMCIIRWFECVTVPDMKHQLV